MSCNARAQVHISQHRCEVKKVGLAQGKFAFRSTLLLTGLQYATYLENLFRCCMPDISWQYTVLLLQTRCCPSSCLCWQRRQIAPWTSELHGGFWTCVWMQACKGPCPDACRKVHPCNIIKRQDPVYHVHHCPRRNDVLRRHSFSACGPTDLRMLHEQS